MRIALADKDEISTMNFAVIGSTGTEAITAQAKR